uniref:Caspase family p20 domain-containing protein n=1 Tax=Papio anubis TaxID=9555 RepID=A0A8I5N990_PAPAN
MENSIEGSSPQAVPVWGNPAMPTSSGSGRSVKLCSLDEAKRIWKEKSTEVPCSEHKIYPIMDKSSRTRLALIICNEEFDSLSKRTGAEVDIIGITMLLQNLGYKVDVKRNLTASEGICGKKYSEQVPDVLQLNAIFEMLNTRNCRSLKDKPKVIIIQACRGENRGVVLVKIQYEPPKIYLHQLQEILRMMLLRKLR